MELHNGRLLWDMDRTELKFKKKTMKDHYDIVIVGGGISGSLCAYTLANEKLTVAVVDKGKMGSGSTLANTGLLHFTNDILLQDLITQIGAAKAVRFYEMCQEAINKLDGIAKRLPFSCEFARRKTFYYASHEGDVHQLKKEYETLINNGFEAELWTRKEIENHFPFSKPAAIVTHHDAEMNPVKFNSGILDDLNIKGVDLFENVHVDKINEVNSGLELETSIGTFHSDHVIFATGYEKTPSLSEPRLTLNRTYVMASERIADLSAWKDRAQIWETKRPYIYLRTTADGRILAGGLDEKVPVSPSDEVIRNRAELLKLEVKKLFPGLEIKIACAWGAVFGESQDSIPFIGKHPYKDRIYYLLGYGGNGTVYSMLGSTIIRDLILEKSSKDAEIVRLDR